MDSAFTKNRAIPIHLIPLIAAIALGLGIFSLLSALATWLYFHFHFPIRDILRIVPFVNDVLEQGLFSQDVGEWFAIHSGAHRITMTRIAMVVDHGYLSGRNHFIYLITWISIATLFVVWVSAFKRSYRKEHEMLLFVSGLSLAFLLSHTQTWNLNNPINSSWYACFAASVASAYLIVRSARPPAAGYILGAYLLAIVAALSNFAGIFIALFLPLLVALRSVRLGLFSAAVSAALLFLYTRDFAIGSALDGVFASGTLPDAAQEVQRQVRRASRVFVFLGSPLSVDHPRTATALVVLSGLLLGWGWITLLRARRLAQPPDCWRELMLTMATLMLAVALATTFGRGLFLEATADRYQTVVMIYWFSICGLMISVSLQEGKASSWSRVASTLLCLVTLGLLLAGEPSSVLKSADMAERASRFSVLKVMGVSENLVDDGLVIRGQPEVLSEQSPLLRARNSGYWRDAASNLDMHNATDCSEAALRIGPSKWPGVFEIKGRIRDVGLRFYRQIPLSSPGRAVIGYLLRDFSGKVTRGRLLWGEENWWKGYLRMEGVPADEVYLHYRRSLFSSAPCRLTLSQAHEHTSGSTLAR